MKLFFKFFMIILIGYSVESYSQSKIQNDSLLNKPVKHSYKKIGLAYGTPGDINIVFGASNQEFCIDISAGMNGLQFGGGITFLSEKNIELNLLLNISYLKIEEEKKMNYSFNLMSNSKKGHLCLGPILECNLYGFHSQFGIGFGLEQIPSPPIFFQIGYAYRWGK